MNASLERRLTALETAHAPGSQRRYLLMPWELMPAPDEGDLIESTNLIALLPYGEGAQYKRNGIHPRDDAPGSWNRHLYFGEPLDA